jgi:virulence-associated protein VagC
MRDVIEVKNSTVRLPGAVGRRLNGRKVVVLDGEDEVVIKPVRPLRASDIARLLPYEKPPPLEEIAAEVRKVRRARRRR